MRGNYLSFSFSPSFLLLSCVFCTAGAKSGGRLAKRKRRDGCREERRARRTIGDPISPASSSSSSSDDFSRLKED